jgi:arylsulfatase A-like enzyme
VLRLRGYHTVGFAGNLLYTSYESGLTSGFIEYHDYPLTLRQLFLHVPLLQTNLVQLLFRSRSLGAVREALRGLDFRAKVPANEYVSAGAITDAFLSWQTRHTAHPFFAFLNYFDAHGPYRSPPGFQGRFTTGDPARDHYDAAIAYLDAELDRLFQTLRQRGVLGRTVVVVTSDHGELFGEHRLRGHANGLFLPLLEVPLLIAYPPRVPSGVRVDRVVSLQDIPATVLELSSAEAPAALPGTSLARAWAPLPPAGPAAAALSRVIQGRDVGPFAPNAHTWLESVIDDNHHYIRSGLGAEELYAWRTDSLEQFNLAGTPQAGDALHRLRSALEAARVSRTSTLGRK